MGGDIKQALEHHRAGRLQQAEAIYRDLLAREPNDPDALHLLGVIAHQLGQHKTAVALIERATGVNPNVPDYHNNLGQALSALQRLDAAVAAYEQALALRPDYAETHNNLGMALQEQGKTAEAIAAFERAVIVKPDFCEAYYNLGNALQESGKLTEAIAAYQRAIKLEPDDAEAHNNLGIAFAAQRRMTEAIATFERALVLNPNSAETYNNLGNALMEQGDLAEASAAFQKALTLKPNFTQARYNLGVALREQGKLTEAIINFRQALALKPNLSGAHYHLGVVLEALGKTDEAVDAFRKALRLKPNLSNARLGLSSAFRTLKPMCHQPELETDLKACFAAPEVNPQDLAHLSANQLKHKHQARLWADTDQHALLTSLGTDDLLTALLSRTVNVDPEFERVLTALRRWLLFEYRDAGDLPNAHRDFMVALGLQCFNNEYVFNASADEEHVADQLQARCERMCDGNVQPTQALENVLLLFTLYRPPYTLTCARALDAISLDAWTAPVRPLIRRTLREPLEEEEISKGIESLAEINDPTSQAVRAQYEENPYPRWLDVPRVRSTDLRTFLRRSFPHFTPPAFLHGPTRALVAGCGTGLEPLAIAQMCENTDIVAIDLSRRSLAYAIRMSRKLGVDNVRFRHGDILDLARLGEHFELIECLGVLHHMAEPLKGWRVLSELLVPGGVMKIGLYSERAREAVVAAREQIRQRGLAPVASDIKAFRAGILSGDADAALAELADIKDFYSLSTCRDLLFHTKEHRFTLSAIRQALTELGLTFIGFDVPTSQMAQRYRELFPEDTCMVDLSTWEQFEARYPRAFLGMYVLGCQKPALST